jgi:hypothetical protein
MQPKAMAGKTHASPQTDEMPAMTADLCPLSRHPLSPPAPHRRLRDLAQENRWRWPT